VKIILLILKFINFIIKVWPYLSRNYFFYDIQMDLEKELKEKCFALIQLQLDVVALHNRASSYTAPEQFDTFWDWIEEYSEIINSEHPAKQNSKIGILLEITKTSTEYKNFLILLKKIFLNEDTCKHENIIWKIEEMYKMQFKKNNWNAFLFSTLGGLFDSCESPEIINAWSNWEEYHTDGWTLPYKEKP
jgi:hypothetical protein